MGRKKGPNAGLVASDPSSPPTAVSVLRSNLNTDYHVALQLYHVHD